MKISTPITNMAKKFGIHPIQYGVVKDHSLYENIQVSIEVHQDRPTTGLVFLNGREVGQVEYVGKKNYRVVRHDKSVIEGFKELGKATAAVISDVIDLPEIVNVQ
jgi:hypothetical protein